ncbi:TIGR03915 family putative DNA repair protein [Utexia brackfieldae]|uniref:TIGR03915 family putative DNA repair protein n=1 Tax=Utexia brackfieldae TaxID=3074108 RepID=UPI00370D07AF
MNIFYFDNTFQGLLCAVFDAYKLKSFPDALLCQGEIEPLLTEQTHQVDTVNSKYERVSQALQKKLSKFALNQLSYVWLAQTPESRMLIFRYIRKVFDSPRNIEQHFADPDILAVKQLAKKVSHERHYVLMFVRFNKTADDIYFSPIAPRYNVLPLVCGHFKDRFADQKWAIYDEQRGYGYFFDGKQIMDITLDDASDFLVNGRLNQQYMAEGEEKFMQMWRNYFKALTIKERINPKLQKQFMPKRFWKHLPETWQDEA